MPDRSLLPTDTETDLTDAEVAALLDETTSEFAADDDLLDEIEEAAALRDVAFAFTGRR